MHKLGRDHPDTTPIYADFNECLLWHKSLICKSNFIRSTSSFFVLKITFWSSRGHLAVSFRDYCFNQKNSSMLCIGVNKIKIHFDTSQLCCGVVHWKKVKELKTVLISIGNQFFIKSNFIVEILKPEGARTMRIRRKAAGSGMLIKWTLWLRRGSERNK